MIEESEVFGGEQFLRDFTNTKVVPYTNIQMQKIMEDILLDINESLDNDYKK